MSGAIVLEDVIDRDWTRKLSVMANSERDLEPYRALVPEMLPGNVRVAKEAGAWHLRAYWPLRGRLDLPVPCGVWPMVAWWIGEGRVSRAIIDAGDLFMSCFSTSPMFAFVRSIPPGAEEFVEVGWTTLIQASWVPEGYLAVVRGAMQQLSAGTWSVKKGVSDG